MKLTAGLMGGEPPHAGMKKNKSCGREHNVKAEKISCCDKMMMQTLLLDATNQQKIEFFA